jgi:hypothetical protein
VIAWISNKEHQTHHDNKHDCYTTVNQPSNLNPADDEHRWLEKGAEHSQSGKKQYKEGNGMNPVT